MDLVGPLPPSRGFTHLLTAVDRTSRWVEAVPLTSTTAADCVAAFSLAWVARHGVPEVVTSDRGVQFTSATWRSFCDNLGVASSFTTAFHPQSNGMVERWHRRLKDALRAREASQDWAAHLPWVLLALRAAPHEDTATSPAEAVFGAQLVLPGQLLAGPEISPSRGFLDAMARTPAVGLRKAAGTAAADLPPALWAAEMVLVRRDGYKPPLSPLYAGPYKVLSRSLRFFKIQLGDRQETVSTSRLKAAVTQAGTGAASPPKRGRPAKKRIKHVTFMLQATVIPPVEGQRPRRATKRPDFFSP